MRDECQSLNSSLEELEIKFRERSAGGGGLGGLFGRSPETLKREINGLDSLLTQKNSELGLYRDKLNRIKQRAEDQASQMQKLSAQTRGVDRIVSVTRSIQYGARLRKLILLQKGQFWP